MTTDPQVTCHVLMVRPARFGPNAETAASNAFQRQPSATDPSPAEVARREFDHLAASLRAAGVDVIVADDTASPAKPDAVFPNNWISFHEDGTVILYPLEAPSRRAERRPELVEWLERERGFRVRRVVDLSPLERAGQFLEGTGSLVIDHANAVAYAALSTRTHEQAVCAFARETGIETVTFKTRDQDGMPLYHTNVMLSIGERFAVVCADVIPDTAERRRVVGRLAASGRGVLQITPARMRAFAANILEIATTDGRSVIAMSAAARDAFGPGDIEVLGRHAAIVAVPIPTIERVGGGSVRCMLAEIFLPGGV